MTDNSIIVGSTVRLADIPSPLMRVINIEPDGRIRCFWFNRRQEPETTVFRREMLQRSPPYVYKPRALGDPSGDHLTDGLIAAEVTDAGY